MLESNEIDALRDAVRDVLNDRLALDSVRRFVNSGARNDDALLRTAAELGWFGMALPEAYGGSGLGFAALAALYEELGRFLAPLPFLPTALCAQALAEGGDEAQRSAWLPLIACGECAAAVASPGDALRGNMPALKARGAGFVLSGQVSGLLSPAGARLLLVFARDEAGATRAILLEPARDGIEIEIGDAADLTRHIGQVSFEGHEFSPARMLPKDGAALAERLLAHASLALACDSVGGAARILDLTVDYLKTRQQFGRPVGSFQALKHRCADLKTVLEASSAFIGEAIGHAEGHDAPRWASMAKFYGCDAYASIAADAIQLHGGIGFTWEHYCHLFLKRALLNQQMCGGSEWHRDRAARLLIAQEAA